MAAAEPPGFRPPGLRATRRRRIRPFVVIGIVLVVLIAGFFVADAAAKAYAQQQIRTQLASALGLDSSAGIGVDVGGGSILLQALTGRLDTLDVTVPELAFGELVGSADIHATGIPLDTGRPLRTLSGTYTVDEDHVAVLASSLSGLDLDSVTLTQPEIVAAAHVTVLGASIPIGVGLTPSVAKGELVFTPSSIRVAGQAFTASSIRESPIFGGLATRLLQQQPFCVAQYLPSALTLSSVKVVGHRLVAGFTADGATIGGTDFSTKGSCS